MIYNQKTKKEYLMLKKKILLFLPLLVYKILLDHKYQMLLLNVIKQVLKLEWLQVIILLLLEPLLEM